MCGIAGCASVGREADLGTGVLAALRHRGPDNAGFLHKDGTSGSWTLAHTRLSIVDLSEAANQPLANEDETLFLSYNGEIYNSPELRRHCEKSGHRFRSHSDGEVILHLWEMEGPSGLARLNGIFAIALADSRTGEVVLARDPMGVKPLFLSYMDSTLWFASELEALKVAGAPIGSMDPVALAQFLSFLWVPDPRTPYSGCRSILPGHVVRWSNGTIEDSVFVDVIGESTQQEDLFGVDLVEQGAQLIREAMSRQLLSDVPIGIMASGGIDSSLLWWAARGKVDRAITIDWSHEVRDEGLAEDTHAVGLLGESLGTPVHYLPGSDTPFNTLPSSGDLFADPAFQLTRRIASYAHDEGLKVLVSGHGGDELFGGYRRHLIAPLLGRGHFGAAGRSLANLLQGVPGRNVSVEYLARLARAVGESDELSGYMQLCMYSTAAERARVLDCTEAEVSNDVVCQRHREVFERLPRRWSRLRRVRALDLAVYLPGLGLAYTDRGGMEHSVEIRVPLLDLDLVRWGLRLPDEALVRHRTGKWLLRELATRELPDLIGARPKRGFGVPTHMLRTGTGSGGQRGFRQGAYFGLAEQLLGEFISR
ncbi:MAG: asparagine synthase (glutamine-hydrolyzing) [Acidimicrobiales bacterium]